MAYHIKPIEDSYQDYQAVLTFLHPSLSQFLDDLAMKNLAIDEVPSMFAGQSLQEVQETSKAIVDRVGELLCFSMWAAFEGCLRRDLSYRQREGLRDPISEELVERFRQEHEAGNYRPSLDSIIGKYFELYQVPDQQKQKADQLREFRDWIAHGKAWKRPEKQFDTESAAAVLRDVADYMELSFPRNPEERLY